MTKQKFTSKDRNDLSNDLKWLLIPYDQQIKCDQINYDRMDPKNFNDDRIMVVDDEEFCLTTIKSMLFNLGIDTQNQVDFCINGLEALNALKNAQKSNIRYKLIFTDFNMPVMNGIESTSQMRSYLLDELKIPRSR